MTLSPGDLPGTTEPVTRRDGPLRITRPTSETRDFPSDTSVRLLKLSVVRKNKNVLLGPKETSEPRPRVSPRCLFSLQTAGNEITVEICLTAGRCLCVILWL